MANTGLSWVLSSTYQFAEDFLKSVVRNFSDRYPCSSLDEAKSGFITSLPP
ncbi:hypothetical protein [Scytonema sp. NUACC21]